MGFRKKLNTCYFVGCLVVAGLCGAATASWTAFSITALLLLVSCFYGGSIRRTDRAEERGIASLCGDFDGAKFTFTRFDRDRPCEVGSRCSGSCHTAGSFPWLLCCR